VSAWPKSTRGPQADRLARLYLETRPRAEAESYGAFGSGSLCDQSLSLWGFCLCRVRDGVPENPQVLAAIRTEWLRRPVQELLASFAHKDSMARQSAADTSASAESSRTSVSRSLTETPPHRKRGQRSQQLVEHGIPVCLSRKNARQTDAKRYTLAAARPQDGLFAPDALSLRRPVELSGTPHRLLRRGFVGGWSTEPAI
jgi:hypothetical protein